MLHRWYWPHKIGHFLCLQMCLDIRWCCRWYHCYYVLLLCHFGAVGFPLKKRHPVKAVALAQPPRPHRWWHRWPAAMAVKEGPCRRVTSRDDRRPSKWWKPAVQISGKLGWKAAIHMVNGCEWFVIPMDLDHEESKRCVSHEISLFWSGTAMIQLSCWLSFQSKVIIMWSALNLYLIFGGDRF